MEENLEEVYEDEEVISVLEPLYIIDKKRKNENPLTKEEIEYFFNEYIKKNIKDYQMSSLLMAICINGLDDNETINLCETFINSGITLNLEGVDGVIVDKHSTGGIGDKTTFIIAPVLASCGVKVCKMSGRGLGITGGTIDKLESIPGLKLDLSQEEIVAGLNKVGMVICSQSDELAPMDKEIYALRDVSGTVSSPYLIAVSIMSKKIACATDKIYIDLKVGRGALIKNEEEALKLKEVFELLAEHFGKEVTVEMSGMNTPLGTSVGNGLEVIEALDVLKGKEKSNLTKIATKIIVSLLMMAKGITEEEALKEATDALSSGRAYNKFLEFVENQGGDIKGIEVSSKKKIFKAPYDGLILRIDALKIGELVQKLGGGRTNKEDNIDRGVGIYFFKTEGEEVKAGVPLCTIFYNEVELTDDEVKDAYRIVQKKAKEAATQPAQGGMYMTPEMQQMMMQQMLMQQMMIEQMMSQMPQTQNIASSALPNLDILNQAVPVTAPTPVVQTAAPVVEVNTTPVITVDTPSFPVETQPQEDVLVTPQVVANESLAQPTVEVVETPVAVMPVVETKQSTVTVAPLPEVVQPTVEVSPVIETTVPNVTPAIVDAPVQKESSILTNPNIEPVNQQQVSISIVE